MGSGVLVGVNGAAGVGWLVLGDACGVVTVGAGSVSGSVGVGGVGLGLAAAGSGATGWLSGRLGALEGTVFEGVSGVPGEILGVEAGSAAVCLGFSSGARNGEFEGVSSIAFMLTLCFNHPGSSPILQAISTTVHHD